MGPGRMGGQMVWRLCQLGNDWRRSFQGGRKLPEKNLEVLFGIDYSIIVVRCKSLARYTFRPLIRWCARIERMASFGWKSTILFVISRKLNFAILALLESKMTIMHKWTGLPLFTRWDKSVAVEISSLYLRKGIMLIYSSEIPQDINSTLNPASCKQHA